MVFSRRSGVGGEAFLFGRSASPPLPAWGMLAGHPGEMAAHQNIQQN
jgi:hypothetical protein